MWIRQRLQNTYKITTAVGKVAAIDAKVAALDTNAAKATFANTLSTALANEGVTGAGIEVTGASMSKVETQDEDITSGAIGYKALPSLIILLTSSLSF